MSRAGAPLATDLGAVTGWRTFVQGIAVALTAALASGCALDLSGLGDVAGDGGAAAAPPAPPDAALPHVDAGSGGTDAPAPQPGPDAGDTGAPVAIEAGAADDAGETNDGREAGEGGNDNGGGDMPGKGKGH